MLSENILKFTQLDLFWSEDKQARSNLSNDSLDNVKFHIEEGIICSSTNQVHFLLNEIESEVINSKINISSFTSNNYKQIIKKLSLCFYSNYFNYHLFFSQNTLTLSKFQILYPFLNNNILLLQDVNGITTLHCLLKYFPLSDFFFTLIEPFLNTKILNNYNNSEFSSCWNYLFQNKNFNFSIFSLFAEKFNCDIFYQSNNDSPSCYSILFSNSYDESIHSILFSFLFFIKKANPSNFFKLVNQFTPWHKLFTHPDLNSKLLKLFLPYLKLKDLLKLNEENQHCLHLLFCHPNFSFSLVKLFKPFLHIGSVKQSKNKVSVESFYVRDGVNKNRYSCWNYLLSNKNVNSKIIDYLRCYIIEDQFFSNDSENFYFHNLFSNNNLNSNIIDYFVKLFYADESSKIAPYFSNDFSCLLDAYSFQASFFNFPSQKRIDIIQMIMLKRSDFNNNCLHCLFDNKNITIDIISRFTPYLTRTIMLELDQEKNTCWHYLFQNPNLTLEMLVYFLPFIFPDECMLDASNINSIMMLKNDEGVTCWHNLFYNVNLKDDLLNFFSYYFLQMDSKSQHEVMNRKDINNMACWYYLFQNEKISTNKFITSLPFLFNHIIDDDDDDEEYEDDEEEYEEFQKDSKARKRARYE